jgi:hypothetical protein
VIGGEHTFGRSSFGEIMIRQKKENNTNNREVQHGGVPDDHRF